MKLLAELNKEKEEAKRIKTIKERIYKQVKHVDRILREKPTNAFEKVYTSLAVQKIIDELAIQYSLGKIEVSDKDNSLEVSIIAPQMTTTDIKNLINREKNNLQVYTLLEALKEVDDFQIFNNPAGAGVVVKIIKNFKI
ncbi:MAG TPA: hypothetical protein PKY81_04470 [bacterium]|nr:hypothetical protein [bacterium]HPN30190.1 hypothetical protein [bacterium]